MTEEQKRISKHDLEMQTQQQCSMCSSRCTHKMEDKPLCECKCKLQNLRGDCLHFLDKRDTYKRD